MRKRAAARIEWGTFCLLVILVIRWAWTQNGWFEPYTAVCACILGGLEIYRRSQWEDTGHAAVSDDSTPSLLAWLIANASSKELSETLPKALQLAKELGDKDFEKWICCELNGYSPRTMDAADTVPEYRTIAGRHMDVHGRPLMIQDVDLSFVNEDRLRFGVRELESYAKKGGTLYLSDPGLISIIKEHLNVDVCRFACSSASIFGILESVRGKLLDHLVRVEKSQAKIAQERDQSKRSKTAAETQSVEKNLDAVELKVMKALMENQQLTPHRTAVLIGCKPAVAEHRLQRLSRARLVRSDSFSGDGAGYHLTFEGRDWLHRHGHLD
jgi:hypothetical protein